jgi:dimethylamine monooxygenase subunit A
MLPYFPFTTSFDKMGTSSLPSENLIVEIDEHYYEEIILKRKLLQNDHEYYFQASPVTKTAQWEVLEKILVSLSTSYPDKFTFERKDAQCSWDNKLLEERIDFVFGDNSSLLMEPLDWVGRQVQEDLLLLDTSSVLQAGQLCFPSGWDIQWKFQKNFMALHAPVPSVMGPTLRAADKLIERIPVNKPIARTNWGFRVSEQMDFSTRHRENYLKLLDKVSPEINSENAGEKIFVRSERQTLSRLPESDFVLFTIHTYNSKVKEETQNIDHARAMLSFVKSAPPELIEYKVMTPYVKSLIGYLERVVG